MSSLSFFRVGELGYEGVAHVAITDENFFFFNNEGEFGLVHPASFFNHYVRLEYSVAKPCETPDFTVENRIWWKAHKKNFRFYTKSPLPHHLTEHILMMNGKVTKREVLIKGLDISGLQSIDLYPPESRCVPSAVGAD